jgi:hypothetical protein
MCESTSRLEPAEAFWKSTEGLNSVARLIGVFDNSNAHGIEHGATASARLEAEPSQEG